jgi:hypothetical protein
MPVEGDVGVPYNRISPMQERASRGRLRQANFSCGELQKIKTENRRTISDITEETYICILIVRVVRRLPWISSHTRTTDAFS